MNNKTVCKLRFFRLALSPPQLGIVTVVDFVLPFIFRLLSFLFLCVEADVGNAVKREQTKLLFDQCVSFSLQQLKNMSPFI